MRGRPRKEGSETVQVAFRLPTGLLDRLDAFAERLGKELPGLTITRADAARVLLTKALDAEDQRHEE